MTQEEIMAGDQESVSDAAAWPLPKLTHVDALSVRDGNVTWRSAGTESQLGVDTVVLIWKASSASGGEPSFVTCCLEERDDSAHSPSSPPFELVTLVSRHVPAQLLEEHLVVELPRHLRHGNDQGDGLDITAVVSTRSGTGQSSAFWHGVVQPLFDLTTHRVDASATAGGATAATTKTTTTNQAAMPRPRVLITQDADSVSHFARTLVSGDGDIPTPATPRRQTIVLLSGDGGVVDLLNGRDSDGDSKDTLPPQQRTPQPLIALIPMGTGNAMFHSLHKPLYASSGGPSPLVLSLRTLFRGRPAQLPAFRASFSQGSLTAPPSLDVDGSAQDAETRGKPIGHLNGAIVASFGFHASIVYESDTPAHRRHGIKRFGLVAQELLRESHPYAARVEVRRPGQTGPGDGFVALQRGTHAYVLATMVSNLERGFTISPAGSPLDGRLRLVHFGPVGGERTMQAMMAAYDDGKHVDLVWDDGERVGYEEVEEVKVVVLEEKARWRKVCVDGTIVELPVGGAMTVSRLKNSGFDIVVNPSVVDGAA